MIKPERLFKIGNVLLFVCVLILVVSFGMAQPTPAGSADPSAAHNSATIPHAESLVNLSSWIIVALLGIILWVLKQWYASLKEWREEITKAIGRHNNRLLVIETALEIHPQKEE